MIRPYNEILMDSTRLRLLLFFLAIEFRLGIFPVQHPGRRIVHDVLTDSIQRFVVADDRFIIIALPHVADAGVFPHPFRHTDFEPANDGPDRLRRPARPRFRPVL